SLAVERLRQGLWFVQNDTDAPREVRIKHADCAPAQAYRLDDGKRAGELPVTLRNGAWLLQIPAKSKVEIIVSGASIQQFRADAAKTEESRR
ncbi:MAG: hypothetical protein HN904_19055, partial [Victivallales bacterium]|nr:hypothetical protein [Victivallales bacterium]